MKRRRSEAVQREHERVAPQHLTDRADRGGLGQAANEIARRPGVVRLR
jgi:hypothetical protein